jgi:hypothetical protein
MGRLAGVLEGAANTMTQIVHLEVIRYASVTLVLLLYN